MLLALLCPATPATADCVILDYRLPDDSGSPALEALARGLVAHLDWLHANGVRFVRHGDQSGNVPAVCLSFTGPESLLDGMVKPILEAWSAPARLLAGDAAHTPEAGEAGAVIVLAPSAPLADLISGLAAHGLRSRSAARAGSPRR